jgi:hypothetical protein
MMKATKRVAHRNAPLVVGGIVMGVVVVTLLIGISQLLATQQRQITYSDRTRREWYQNLSALKQHAEVAVVGTVTGTRSVERQRSLVFTTYDFTISQVIYDRQHKLPNGDNRIPLFQMSTVDANQQPAIGDDPPFQIGERVIVFLHLTPADGYPSAVFYVAGGPSGRFRIKGDGTVEAVVTDGVQIQGGMTAAAFVDATQRV